jgi:hypothetical protein
MAVYHNNHKNTFFKSPIECFLVTLNVVMKASSSSDPSMSVVVLRFIKLVFKHRMMTAVTGVGA